MRSHWTLLSKSPTLPSNTTIEQAMEEGSVSAHTFSSITKAGAHSRTWEQELKQRDHRGRQLTSLLSLLSYIAQDCLPKGGTNTVIKKMFPQTCQQANLIEALSQLKFAIPPMNPACIKLIN